jgi:hypothetical protein
MSLVRIPSLTIHASNRRMPSLSGGWSRSSLKAASAFMTTALIVWPISAIDTDSCSGIASAGGTGSFVLEDAAASVSAVLWKDFSEF